MTGIAVVLLSVTGVLNPAYVLALGQNKLTLSQPLTLLLGVGLNL